MEKRYSIHIPGYYGTTEQLAEKIGELRYDINLRINHELVQIYRRQAEEDQKSGHPQLARLLRQYADIMEKSSKKIEEIYALCRNKPGMRDE
jgi:hypothetical protein